MDIWNLSKNKLSRRKLRGIQSVFLDSPPAKAHFVRRAGRQKHSGMTKNLNRAMHDCILRPPAVMPADFRRASIKRSNLPAAHTTCLWQAHLSSLNIGEQAGLRGIKPEKE